MAQLGYTTGITGIRYPADPTSILKSGIVLGEPSLPDTASKGFIYLPIIEGRPSAKPLPVEGFAAIAVNRKDGEICVFYDDEWHFTQIRPA